jgi:hypothetical protein
MGMKKRGSVHHPWKLEYPGQIMSVIKYKSKVHPSVLGERGPGRRRISWLKNHQGSNLTNSIYCTLENGLTVQNISSFFFQFLWNVT